MSRKEARRKLVGKFIAVPVTNDFNSPLSGFKVGKPAAEEFTFGGTLETGEVLECCDAFGGAESAHSLDVHSPHLERGVRGDGRAFDRHVGIVARG